MSLRKLGASERLILSFFGDERPHYLSEISRRTRLERRFVYECLAPLMRFGLVAEITPVAGHFAGALPKRRWFVLGRERDGWVYRKGARGGRFWFRVAERKERGVVVLE